jgi:hypothetical protein
MSEDRVPRPKPTLRVGITGHRPRPGIDEDAVARRLAAEFRRLRTVAEGIAREEAAVFADGGAECVLVSALAEGADRAAAHAALAEGFRLECVLPLPRADYRADFAGSAAEGFDALLGKASAVFELPAPRAPRTGDDAEREAERTRGRDRSYATGGFVMLNQIDLLVAVWNGDPPAGPGGTGAIVEMAVNAGIPVLHIRSGAPDRVTLLWEAQGALPFRLHRLDGLERDADDAAIRAVLDALLAPPRARPAPAPAHGRDEGAEERRRLTRFFGETERRLRRRLSYPVMLWLWGIRGPRRADFLAAPYEAAAEARWAGFLDEVGEGEAANLVGPLGTVLRPRYAWADGLADRYAQVFRSGYVTNFGLAALAVLLALLGVVWSSAKVWLVVAELGVIAGILLNTEVGRRCGWHDRWLDYRHLAERLRHLRMLALLGVRPTAAGRPAPGAARGVRWVDWYVRAAGREVGLPDAAVTDGYLDRCRRLLCETELDEQIAYQKASETAMHRLETRLHRLGACLFGATGLICVVFIVGYLAWQEVPDDLKAWVTFLTALLPTVGAAVYAIRVQGDFEGIRDRSAATLAELEAVRAALEVPDAPGDPEQAFIRLADRAEQATEAMTVDVADWRTILIRRPLALPA